MITLEALYTRYNELLNDNDYGQKYDLGNVQMFIIEGMDKVRDVIEKNRKRKLTKHKKLSNNTVILPSSTVSQHFHNPIYAGFFESVLSFS